jgi:integrase
MERLGIPGLQPHMMRHVAATLWLAAHPGDYATVAAFLGDSVKTVEKFYARGEGAAAARLFAEVLESLDPTLGSFLKRSAA